MDGPDESQLRGNDKEKKAQRIQFYLKKIQVIQSSGYKPYMRISKMPLYTGIANNEGIYEQDGDNRRNKYRASRYLVKE